MDNPKGPTVSTGTSTEHSEESIWEKTSRRIDILLCTTESSSCKPKTSTTTEINSTPIENKNEITKEKKKKKWSMKKCCLLVAAIGNYN